MAGQSARGSRPPPGEAGERRECFAALIQAERAAILASYAKSLDALRGAVIAGPGGRDLAMANGAEIIADVVASVQDGGGRIGDRRIMLAWTAAGERTENPPGPADLVRAASLLFDITVNVLAIHVGEDPGLLPCFVTAVLALNESIARRFEEAALAHTGYLLERVERAQIDERRRIARDLHDRLGEGISAALRQLELHEITAGGDPLASQPRVASAKEALTEAMRRLRAVTSGLRQDSVRSLERALVQYIDSVAAAAEVQLRVSGDEAWAPPAVIDETFLIIREAIRNALQHSVPSMMRIGVAVAPHELHAWVEDDGCGFAPAEGADLVRSGTGLASMRERAGLLGGQLTVASALGQGTHVELLVPLAGRRDE